MIVFEFVMSYTAGYIGTAGAWMALGTIVALTVTAIRPRG